MAASLIGSDKQKHVEFQKYKRQKDMEKYGNYQNGEYKGWKWEMIRYEHSLVWCGYVFYDDIELTNEEKENHIFFHGGLTYDDGKKIGFDCNHVYDFSKYYKGEFRDFNYVFTCIQNYIDYIVELK